MPRFSYNAIDAEGRNTVGEIEAPTAADARRRLEEQGLRVESVEGVSPAPSASVANSVDKPVSLTLSQHDFETISDEVAGLTRARLPLSTGLAILAEELPSGRLRRGMDGMARQLETGVGLEEVFASYGAPNELRALVRSGLRAGRIDDALAQYVAHRRARSSIRLRATLALGYPLVMALLGLAVIIFFFIFVVPPFKAIFDDFSMNLPGITKLLLSVSDFMAGYGWMIIVAVLIGIVAVPLARRLIYGDGGWRSVLSVLPVARSLRHWDCMARFCHLLAVLIDNKLPLPEAITLAGESVGDDGIRDASRDLALRITAGEPLDPRIRSLRGFPSALIQIVTEQKQTAALPEALHAIADMFEGRSRLQSNLVAAICGPLMLVAIGLTLGFIVLSLYMPLIKLINDLS